MAMFELSEEKAAEWKQQLIEQVQPHVNGEQVLALAPFRRGGFGEQVLALAPFRRGGFGAQVAISKAGGGIAYAAHALFRKKQAGGLPERVMLVVTPAKLYAFTWTIRGRTYKIKKEVAVWDRAGLQVSTEKGKTLTMLTIESPDEDEKATLAPRGGRDDPLSQEVMQMLQGGAAASSA